MNTTNLWLPCCFLFSIILMSSSSFKSFSSPLRYLLSKSWSPFRILLSWPTSWRSPFSKPLMFWMSDTLICLRLMSSSSISSSSTSPWRMMASMPLSLYEITLLSVSWCTWSTLSTVFIQEYHELSSRFINSMHIIFTKKRSRFTSLSHSALASLRAMAFEASR